MVGCAATCSAGKPRMVLFCGCTHMSHFPLGPSATPPFLDSHGMGHQVVVRLQAVALSLPQVHLLPHAHLLLPAGWGSVWALPLLSPPPGPLQPSLSPAAGRAAVWGPTGPLPLLRSLPASQPTTRAGKAIIGTGGSQVTSGWHAALGAPSGLPYSNSVSGWRQG